MFVPPEIIPHAIRMLNERIERERRIAASIVDDVWPPSFDANDVWLYETVLATMEGHATSGFDEASWNSKPIATCYPSRARAPKPDRNRESNRRLRSALLARIK
jgi:hypothetical protein